MLALVRFAAIDLEAFGFSRVNRCRAARASDRCRSQKCSNIPERATRGLASDRRGVSWRLRSPVHDELWYKPVSLGPRRRLKGQNHTTGAEGMLAQSVAEVLSHHVGLTVLQSRATDNTGYVQPTREALVAERGTKALPFQRHRQLGGRRAWRIAACLWLTRLRLRPTRHVLCGSDRRFMTSSGINQSHWDRPTA